MTRKFSYKKETWIGFGLFHFKNGNLDAARKVLPRSLKSLSKENRKSIQTEWESFLILKQPVV